VKVGPDESRAAYTGSLVDVTVERWGDYEREIVEHPGAVAIVAVDGDDRITLVRQFREPTRAWLVELPAGTIDVREEPLATARRELREETGLGGGEWRVLGEFWTTPGFCRERMTVFLADGVEAIGAPTPEDDERLEVVRWPVAELDARVATLEDAKTLAGLLLYLRHRGLMAPARGTPAHHPPRS
jgi:ADP-ribose pyrophosphatase